MKHTPGPWRMADKILTWMLDSGWAVVADDGDFMKVVANAWKADDSLSSMKHDEQGQANARLIAAAPEMLELLRDAAIELKSATTAYAAVVVDEINALLRRVEGQQG